MFCVFRNASPMFTFLYFKREAADKLLNVVGFIEENVD